MRYEAQEIWVVGWTRLGLFLMMQLTGLNVFRSVHNDADSHSQGLSSFIKIVFVSILILLFGLGAQG